MMSQHIDDDAKVIFASISARSTRESVNATLGKDRHTVNEIRRTLDNHAVTAVRPVLPSTGSEEHLVRK